MLSVGDLLPKKKGKTGKFLMTLWRASLVSGLFPASLLLLHVWLDKHYPALNHMAYLGAVVSAFGALSCTHYLKPKPLAFHATMLFISTILAFMFVTLAITDWRIVYGVWSLMSLLFVIINIMPTLRGYWEWVEEIAMPTAAVHTKRTPLDQEHLQEQMRRDGLL